MDQHPRTIAPEVIACIAEGRPPTPEELSRVAQRIRPELSVHRGALGWAQAEADSVEALSLLVAEAALIGGGR